MVEKKIQMAYQYSFISKDSMSKKYIELFNSLPESKKTKKAYNDTLNAIASSEIRTDQLLQNELDKIRLEEGIYNGANLLSKFVPKRIN